MLKTLFIIIFCLGLNSWAQNEVLAVAVERDDLTKIRRLIVNGQISVDEKVRNEEPILVTAARAGAEKITQYLISKSVQVNALNAFRENALMLAVFFNDSSQNNSHEVHDRIARYLIEAGATLENNLWWTPLAYAAYAGRVEMVEYLLAKGAAVNGPVVNNITPIKTPLMMASMQGHDQLARYLLIHGANANIKTEKNVTAYSLAEKYNYKKLLKYLQCAMELSPEESYQQKCENFIEGHTLVGSSL